MALSRKEIGQRLRDVRETIGFTQAQVAEKFDVHRPTISEIEAGRRAVTSEELYRFAELYATAVSDLLADPKPSTEAAVEVLYRRQGAERPETRVAIRRFVERCRAEHELKDLLGLPPRTDARPGYRATAPATKGEAIQQGSRMAEQERRRLDIGGQPVRSVTELLERQGVTIGPVTPQGGDALDGFYLESEELGPCIAVNPGEEWTGLRAAFTAAHEYAHWLLRDRQVELFAFQARTDDLLEVRANAFAASFLMPEAGLRDYLDGVGLLEGNRAPHFSPGDVVRAMGHFGVSRTALLFRLLNLGLIDEPTRLELSQFPIAPIAKALQIDFGSRRYVGMRLPMLAIHAWRRGLIGASRAAALCELDLVEYKQLVRDIGEEPEPSADTSLLGAAAVG